MSSRSSSRPKSPSGPAKCERPASSRSRRAMMDAKAPVGVVGLGLMGSAIAARLREAGFVVVGFDTDAETLARGEALGVQRAASARAIAEQCTCIVLAVFDTSQVEQVIGEIPSGAR